MKALAWVWSVSGSRSHHLTDGLRLIFAERLLDIGLSSTSPPSTLKHFKLVLCSMKVPRY